jgi:putative hydrolase of the HAD superfamily
MPLRALIFDFDGLIIDTESAIFQSWRELYESHGQELTVERWSQEQELTARVHELLDGFDALPGVRDRLSEARELGLPCSVASSSPLTWVSKHLNHLDLHGHFTNISCRDHVERIKPHPDLFLDAARKLGAAPDEVVIFEDSLNGLNAARAAGMRCVVIPGPTTQHLDFTGAWHRLDSLGSTSVAELASMFG